MISKKNNLSLTGIRQECVFNKIPSFHVTENFAVDITHDIFEGVAIFDFIEIFCQFIFIDKIITIDTLNSKIKYFDYGKNVNKPPLINYDNLRKKKLNMSCAEAKTLILFLGLIVGDLIPINNKFWNLYILLRKILAITLSPFVIVKENHILLKQLKSITLCIRIYLICH